MLFTVSSPKFVEHAVISVLHIVPVTFAPLRNKCMRRRDMSRELSDLIQCNVGIAARENQKTSILTILLLKHMRGVVSSLASSMPA